MHYAQLLYGVSGFELVSHAYTANASSSFDKNNNEVEQITSINTGGVFIFKQKQELCDSMGSRASIPGWRSRA